MDRTTLRGMRRHARFVASQLAVAFAILCGLWLALGEGLTQAVGEKSPVHALLLHRDWVFLFLTTVAVYVFAARILSRADQNEYARTESERTLSSLVTQVPGLVYQCQNDFLRTPEFVSDGCYELTGHRPEDLEGNRRTTLDALIHPEDLPGVQAALRDALDAGRPYRITYRIRTADGEERWVLDSGAGYELTDGTFRKLEGLMVDVTRQKHTELRLEGARQHLQEIVDARTADLERANIDLEHANVDLASANDKLANANLRLTELSRHDGLTKLLNRRSLDDFVQQEHHRCKRYGGRFSVVMIDLDHFKNLNDTYGHQGGDDVLRTVADQLRGSIRNSDKAFRYGGEEMALVLPETEGKAAWLVADRLRATLSAHPLHLTDEHGASHDVTVTYSAGVATFPEDGSTVEQVFAAADQALYQAKRRGRNRVFQCNSGTRPPPPCGRPTPALRRSEPPRRAGTAGAGTVGALPAVW